MTIVRDRQMCQQLVRDEYNQTAIADYEAKPLEMSSKVTRNAMSRALS